MQIKSTFSFFLLTLCVLGCKQDGKTSDMAMAKGSTEHIQTVTSAIDDQALSNKNKDYKNWLGYGLDYAETRYSGLSQITADNVSQLGLSWVYDLNSIRGVEATPIVVDGIMYVTAPWSIVHAIDVRTGKNIWSYDPKVPRSTGEKACCDVVNRGVALYKGKVYVASLDGRLIALDAATGKMVWEKVTLDRTKKYTITGAPRVFKGNVIIGNGGAEYGVRGFITAYDAETGEQKWRWYSVPGDPSKPFEDKSMEMAAKTWDPSGEYWKVGGGGTMWDSMVYDPELDLMYVGVGNGSPWNRRLRSPGGGDNLFLGSIVALDPDTGEYKWHYQETPGDHWDYTSTQPLILADLDIDGKKRKVIMHAPKNGFFFVIDRANGAFISAQNFVDVNWASGYAENGRPIELSEAAYKDGAYEAIPGAFGGHNWHSMSYNPDTGLVYIPAQGVPLVIEEDTNWAHNSSDSGGPHSGIGWNTGVLASAVPPKGAPFGHLLAWDPVAQKAAWKVDLINPWNGGTLTTAGNLVFQGTADGRFVAYNAKNGAKLWEVPTGTGVVAAPATYEVDGEQFVSIAVGWGGVYGLTERSSDFKGTGKVFTFKIGASGELPKYESYDLGPLVAGVEYDSKDVGLGAKLYISNCIFCHGVPAVGKGGNIKNLGHSTAEVIGNLEKNIIDGPYTELGMPNFKGKLTAEDAQKIKAFIQNTAEAVSSAQAAAQSD